MTDHAGTTRPVGRTPPPAKIDAMFSRFTLYFDEVARSGSLRRAAERLNISPSAIDRHILLMEENMGVALFERLPRGCGSRRQAKS
jgi:molybdenum-dependent DNA-binding transcriptional regulator ModE